MLKYSVSTEVLRRPEEGKGNGNPRNSAVFANPIAACNRNPFNGHLGDLTPSAAAAASSTALYRIFSETAKKRLPKTRFSASRRIISATSSAPTKAFKPIG